MKPQYLRVRNWEKFQHYKNRRPPWVRYHVELLDDYELLSLPYTAQLVYDRLLLLAARTDNNIPHDPQRIGGQLNVDPETVGDAIASLLEHGFLTVAESKRSASKALARRKQKSATEAEADTEVSEAEDSDAETDPDEPAFDHDPLGHSIIRLLMVLKDADAGTEMQVRTRIAEYGLAPADVEEAREAAMSDSAKSPTRVAMSVLKTRGEKKRRAA